MMRPHALRGPSRRACIGLVSTGIDTFAKPEIARAVDALRALGE